MDSSNVFPDRLHDLAAATDPDHAVFRVDLDQHGAAVGQFEVGIVHAEYSRQCRASPHWKAVVCPLWMFLLVVSSCPRSDSNWLGSVRYRNTA